jgi:8-oxo-dGTP diphosphatase
MAPRALNRVSNTTAFCYDRGMYPNTIYRVTVKAYITDSTGRVLVVKEKQDFWSLPGGGLEHGESPQDCIKREIKEEIGLSNVIVGEIAYSTIVYLDQRDYWMTWIVYRAKLGSTNFVLGDGVTEAKFIDISEIESSDDLLEKMIVEVAQSID